MILCIHRYIFLLNTLSGGKSCLVAPGVAVPPWATETVLSPWLAADEARVSHVLSHVVWWKKKKKKKKKVLDLIVNSYRLSSNIINWKWCQHTHSKGVDCYWQAIDHMKSDLSKKLYWISSKLKLYQNYWLDAPPGCEWNAGRKSLMETTQEYYMLFWTNPGSSTLEDSSCNLPSQTIQVRWTKCDGALLEK